MSKSDHKSPCTGVCSFNADAVCRGCLRTRQEVRGWNYLSVEEKASVNQRVRPLIAAGSPPESKRLRKLDKQIGALEEKLKSLRAARRALAAETVARS